MKNNRKNAASAKSVRRPVVDALVLAQVVDVVSRLSKGRNRLTPLAAVREILGETNLRTSAGLELPVQDEDIARLRLALTREAA